MLYLGIQSPDGAERLRPTAPQRRSSPGHAKPSRARDNTPLKLAHGINIMIRPV